MRQLEHQDDNALVKCVAAGSEDAFVVLYRHHAPDVVRYAWVVAPSRDSVQPLVQETFLTFWQRSNSIELLGASLLPWLLVTCRNHAHNLRRKESRRKDHVELHDGLIDPREAPREQVRWALETIESLPPKDRRVCELCMLEGYTYAEAAQTIGTTPAAIGKRLQRTRAALKGDWS